MRQKYPYNFSQLESGQALLIVVVAMVVALTISLSVATRSLLNVRTTTEEAQSQQAFSAAEAGVEKLLKSTNPGTPLDETIGSAKFSASQEVISGADLLLNNGTPILRDEGVDVWLSRYPDYASPWPDGRITIYWGNNKSCATVAAIEVVLLTGAASNPISRRYAFDPCSTRAVNENKFTDVSASAGKTVSGIIFANSAVVPPSGNITSGLLMRITPLYANTPIYIEGRTSTGTSNPFPSQGTQISSVGTAGETKRKITVYRGWPKVPTELFGQVLFSP